MINAGLKRHIDERRAGNISIERLDPVSKAKANPNSLRMAINAKCYDCCCGERKEVRECTITDCPLWNLRPWKTKC